MAKEQSNEIELGGFVMPSHVRLPGNQASGLMPGNHYSNGMNVSGIVKRIVLSLHTGIVTLHLASTDGKAIVTRVYIFPSGMMAEEKAQ